MPSGTRRAGPASNTTIAALTSTYTSSIPVSIPPRRPARRSSSARSAPTATCQRACRAWGRKSASTSGSPLRGSARSVRNPTGSLRPASPARPLLASRLTPEPEPSVVNQRRIRHRGAQVDAATLRSQRPLRRTTAGGAGAAGHRWHPERHEPPHDGVGRRGRTRRIRTGWRSCSNWTRPSSWARAVCSSRRCSNASSVCMRR